MSRPLLIVLIGTVACVSILWVRSSRPEATSFADRGDPHRVEAPHKPAQPSAQHTPPVKLGEGVPDASLLAQDGRVFQLRDLRPKVVLVGFIYTHCTVPSMCPQTTAKFVQLQRTLERAGVSGVHFLLVSFAADQDTPARLADFAQLHAVKPSSITLASGSRDQVSLLAHSLNTYYQEGSRGAWEHNITISVIDRSGILRDQLFGNDWQEAELVPVLRKLVEEGARDNPVSVR